MALTKQEARAQMYAELRELQSDLAEHWLERSLPEDWAGLDTREPMKQVKDRVTIRLDADMLRWFRRLGPHYGQRINRVLRIYWMALLGGRIKSHWDEDDLTPAFLSAIEVAGDEGEEEQGGAA